MAGAFTDTRFAKLYNEVTDEILQADLTLRQIKLIIAVIRLSLGETASTSEWTARPVTVIQLASMTRMDRNDAGDALKRLRLSGALEREVRPDGTYWRYNAGWHVRVNHPHEGKSPSQKHGSQAVGAGESPSGANHPHAGKPPSMREGELPAWDEGKSPSGKTPGSSSDKAPNGAPDLESRDATTPAAVTNALLPILHRQVSKRLGLTQVYEAVNKYGALRVKFAGARVAEEKQRRADAGDEAIGNPAALFFGILRASSDDEAAAYFEESGEREEEVNNHRFDEDPRERIRRERAAALGQRPKAPEEVNIVPGQRLGDGTEEPDDTPADREIKRLLQAQTDSLLQRTGTDAVAYGTRPLDPSKDIK